MGTSSPVFFQDFSPALYVPQFIYKGSTSPNSFQLCAISDKTDLSDIAHKEFPNGNNLGVYTRISDNSYRSGIFLYFSAESGIIFLNGNILLAMKLTPEQLGQLVKQTRKAMGVTQKDLALTSGTGLRFIIELEKGKPTCQIGKVLTVLHTLGIKLSLSAPPNQGGKDE